LGVENVDRIGDDAYNYITTWGKSSQSTNNALFDALLVVQGRRDEFCVKALKNLLSLASKDREIARFLYNTPPNTYQHARYSDWFRAYLDNQHKELG